jgi:hypothetical protein
LLLCCVGAFTASAQRAIVTWAYGPFATQGDAAFVIEDNRIYQACGPYGSRGPCLYVIDEDQVYHADASGMKGQGAYLLDGNKLLRCHGTFCTQGTCALLVEGNKVFRADGTFCTKQEGAFLIDGDAVFLAEGAFAQKTDAILLVHGEVPRVALLAILAGL